MLGKKCDMWVQILTSKKLMGRKMFPIFTHLPQTLRRETLCVHIIDVQSIRTVGSSVLRHELQLFTLKMLHPQFDLINYK